MPPENVGSPTQLPADMEANPPWWRPSWRDTLAHMGWRIIFFIPAATLLALVPVCFFFPPLVAIFWMVGFKIIAVILAVPVALASYGFAQGIKARHDPFCIHCGYSLSGLPDNYRCPECGRHYLFDVIEEYRRDPAWFVERWKQRHSHPAAEPFDAGKSSSPRRSRDGAS